MEAIRLLCLNIRKSDWPEWADEPADVDGDSVGFNGSSKGRTEYEWFRRLEIPTSSIEGLREVTREEFLAYHEDNPNLAADFDVERREAICQLAEIGKTVSYALNDGSKLAEAYGIEWIVETDHGSINVPRLNAVDWDSSSMYC